MEDLFYFQDYHQEEEKEAVEEQLEAEEALSLSDLPLGFDSDPPSIETPYNDLSNHPARRSSSQPQDFFEFLTDVDLISSDHIMCSADDIIICGKLIPFKEPPAYSYRSLNPHNPFADDQENRQQEEEEEPKQVQRKATLGLRSRSESSSNLHSINAPESKLTRNSRSLDYRKLHRFSSPMMSNSPETVNMNSSSVKSFGKLGDVLAKRATRPRWYVFMFGMVKFPAEMELEDIKTRQLRRNPTTLFVPTNETTEAATRGGRSSMSRNKGSWKLLKALSCKDHTSVAVTTPFACLPQSESFA
ncbi:uncharacterized protein LOC116198821 [Punica granatum]|uniref:Membrane-associated kinase regulator 6 n=2 Tax=Punica granatum TaxID=22663 RepID=A0A218VZ54_PUNGR|nr:uncharacterized protein LOC116198821 [Punica granatum]OWM65775.1 hypothetical protein CDL15_Pgr015200 [Punica granatum]PKI62364.1 hypothetical protein CRG98_017170 [Punica granatum]